MLKKARLLTRPTPARQDAPCPKQGHGFEADLRFTFHALRFTVLGNDARTPPGKRRVSTRRGWAGEKSDFFSILLRCAARNLTIVGLQHDRAGWFNKH